MDNLIAYEGRFIALGAMREEYAEQFAAWANRRDGIEGTMLRPPYTVAKGRDWIQSLHKDGTNEVFAVLLRKNRGRTHEYIGHMGLHGITGFGGLAISGSVLGASNGRGKGHGTEAKLWLLHHAFHVIGVHEVRSTVKAFNASSMGHLVKCGYQVCGKWREGVAHNGTRVDEHLLQVLKSDFEPIWDKYLLRKQLPKLTTAQREQITQLTS